MNTGFVWPHGHGLIDTCFNKALDVGNLLPVPCYEAYVLLSKLWRNNPLVLENFLELLNS